jgi:hypothetical protein
MRYLVSGIAGIFIITFTGCSVYESDGRKFLERNLDSIGVSVQSNLTRCDHEPTQESWTLLEERADSVVYSSDEEGFRLKITTTLDPAFNCYFKFSSAQEMYEKVQAACERTVQELSDSTPKARVRN